MVDVKKHLLNLYFLALSDGNFDPRELETILEIAHEKGMSREDFNALVVNPPQGAFNVPSGFLEKVFLLYDFSRVILADGVIEDSEVETFMKFCESFGFEQQVSKELFDWLIELAKKKMDIKQVREEINKLIEE